MTTVQLNLNNVSDAASLLSLFPESNDFEFSGKKVYRRKSCVLCSCGCTMVHNGFDFVRKKGIGRVKVGKQICKSCGAQHHEDKGFWKSLLTKWYDTLTALILTLRDSDVSWRVIGKVTNFFIPCSKDTIMRFFNAEVEQFGYPQDNFVIINYDEQHPKKGRIQKFRLTLLNYKTGIPIAEELFDNKDDATIEAFLRKHLDAAKEVIIITDCDRRYPRIFKRIWGNKVIHQKCLLHLNKLIVGDYGKPTSLQDEHNKYLMLNIFYNREAELRLLQRLIKKFSEKKFVNNKEEKEWLKDAKTKFYDSVHSFENRRRKNGKNLTQRKLFKAETIFKELWSQRLLFPKRAQQRLKMIKDNWESFTAFYHVRDCPATNNAVENFYSTSLKTHRKKQLRSDNGILNHMKLAAMKRVKDFTRPKMTFLEIFALFQLIVT